MVYPTRSERGARVVLVAAYMGPAGTLLLALAILLQLPDFIRGFAIGLLIVTVAILLLRQYRDEYFQRLWAGGASWAFVASVLWLTAAPLVLGTFAGRQDVTWAPDVPAIWCLIVMLTAFFAGFHWTSMRAES